MRLTGYLSVVEENGQDRIQCKCGYSICDGEQNFKEHVLLIESPLTKVGPLADVGRRGSSFVFREFCCPECATLLTTEIALRDEPVLHDIQLQTKKS
jgi:N-methylhydantoinase B